MNKASKSALPLILTHERFVKGEAGGCRAHFRFERLPEMVLRKRALDGIEFVGCDLPRTQLLLSSLKSASFYCSNLRDSDLRATDLTRADLRGAILRGADLYRAKLDGADFRKAVLIKADREGEFADFGQSFDNDDEVPDGAVDFRNCSMKGARLNAAKLKGADFSGAILDKADLRGADLRGSNFDGAVLTGADLQGVKLDGASMAGVLRDPDEAARERAAELVKQIEASHQYTTTHGQAGARAVLDGEDLRPLGEALKAKGLVGASLREVCGVGVNFSGSVLVGAVFDGSDLRSARFDGADLRGCSFKNCNLNHAVFDKANLKSFSGGTGRSFPPNFDGASLHSTRFVDAVFDPGADLSDEISDALAEAAA